MPRVSVVIAAYNMARFLPDALESVLAQSLSSWECIVADDGSTDDTAAVAQRYSERDSRIRLLALEHHGVSATRNAAIRASAGEFIQLLDADDRLAGSKLEEQVRFLDQNPATDVVYGDVRFFFSESPDRLMPSPHGRLSKPILNDRVHGAAAALLKLEHYNFFHPGAALARREALETAGLFSETSRAAEDHELWLHCAIAGSSFDHCEHDEPVAFIRSHPGSATREPGKIVRGLIEAATAFPTRGASRRWTRATLPLIYEVAIGISEGERGLRLSAFRRIRHAASASSEPLTSLRWRAYAFAALLLPRSWFFRFVSMPIPESALEWYRRMKSFMTREHSRA